MKFFPSRMTTRGKVITGRSWQYLPMEYPHATGHFRQQTASTMRKSSIEVFTNPPLFLFGTVLADILPASVIQLMKIFFREPAEAETAHDQPVRTLHTPVGLAAAQPYRCFHITSRAP